MAENSAREQVKALTDRLETGVRELFDSDKFADYLKTMSRFHRYSARNVLLIHMQMPEATRVAGYQSWQTKFGRYVKQGEKGLKILAPTPFTVKKERQRLDPLSGTPVIGLDGMPETEEVEVRIPRFKATTVFDVSQTDGKPLPELAEDIPGDVRHYEVFMDALRAVSPLPVVFQALPEDTDGLCRYGREIVIRTGMSERQTVSALVHEITHAMIHDASLQQETEETKSRSAEEVEAESVSYTVCQYYGIETGANSFGYLATWSKGRELKELSASLETIRSTSASLIDSIDRNFRELAKARGVDLAAGTDAPVIEQEAVLPSADGAEPARDNAGLQIPAPGTVYAQYANRMVDLVSADRAYANAVLNSDEQNARTECETAIRNNVVGLLMESTDHIELYRQYMENPDFKGRLEDYVFTKTYLEPLHAGRDTEPELSAPEAEPAQNTEAAEQPWPLVETRPVGDMVLMPMVFDDYGQFERGDRRARVRIEESIGKYPVYSREHGGSASGYLLTESGRLIRAGEYSRMAELTEEQVDSFYAQQCRLIESNLADPDAWADYNAAAVANRLEEADAHNIPVRAAREAGYQRAREEQRVRDEAERLQQEAAFTAKVDGMGEAILHFERVDVELDHYTDKNPLFSLFERHGVELPLATKGWVNRNLKAFQLTDGGRLRCWGPRGMRISDTFMRQLIELRVVMDGERDKQPEQSESLPDKGAAVSAVSRNNYEKFATLFPNIVSGEYRYLRLEAGAGMMPLSVEHIGDSRVSVQHTYTVNGDLAYDPMIVFTLDNDAKTLAASEFEQSIPPLYQRVDENGDGASIDGNGNEREVSGLQRQIDDFASTWLENIGQQGYIPVRAIRDIDGMDTELLFDENGNPAEPPAQAVEAQVEVEEATETYAEQMPDPAISFSERDLYGYTYAEMLPLLRERALELYDANHGIYLLHSDGTESLAFERSEIEGHDGIFGIEAPDWAAILEHRQMIEDTKNSEGTREAELLYGQGDRFGIYQLKPDQELASYRFASMKELQKDGTVPDRANYALVYSALLAAGDTPDAIFDRFNTNRPADFTGHSLSVSDVIVMKQGDTVTSLYTDSFGFEPLRGFVGGETPRTEQRDAREGNTPEPALPTVADYEAQVKAGQQISLTGMAQAIKREQQSVASKEKPSVLAQLREYQQKTRADAKAQTARPNDKERGI